MQRQVGGRQISKEKMSLEILYEKVAEGLLANAVGQNNRPASRQ
jgi:hypothetical protein